MGPLTSDILWQMSEDFVIFQLRSFLGVVETLRFETRCTDCDTCLEIILDKGCGFWDLVFPLQCLMEQVSSNLIVSQSGGGGFRRNVSVLEDRDNVVRSSVLAWPSQSPEDCHTQLSPFPSHLCKIQVLIFPPISPSLLWNKYHTVHAVPVGAWCKVKRFHGWITKVTKFHDLFWVSWRYLLHLSLRCSRRTL